MPSLLECGCAPSNARARETNSLVICLAGNPNVGKSTLFNRLTGSAAETANYPGMTVELGVAKAYWEGRKVQVVDLPGTYALDPTSEDQWVARHGILDWRPDVVVAVVDATNLARNLYLVLQLLDLGCRVVVSLNLMDEARRHSVKIDTQALARELGVPVVPTVARSGEGVRELIGAVLAAGANKEASSSPLFFRYSPAVEEETEAVIGRLKERTTSLPYGLPARAVALALLEEDSELTDQVRVQAPDQVDPALGRGSLALRVAAERHARAQAIASTVVVEQEGARSERWWRLTTSLPTGLPILLGVLGAVFALLFYLGGWLSTLLSSAWTATASPLLTGAVHALLGTGTLGQTILWGLDGGILATLAVAIPYILTFYFILAVIEDSGYMNAAAFLSDRLMHAFGLHGRAVIPLISAAGCNVPAIMGTRVLSSKRERTIACTLVTLTPCSARTAVIIGAVSLYAGWQWALFVFGITFMVGLAAGVLLNRLLPGQAEGLIMEMFPFRRPSLRIVVAKTWRRFSGFIWAAAPIILVGSLALGALYETGLIFHLSRPLSPIVVDWLGLPAVTGLTLIFAVLRKELALQLLVVLAVAKYGPQAANLLKFMTAHQIVVYTLVNTIYIPCVATIAMLGRELGWRRAVFVSAGTTSAAILVGGLVARALRFF